MTYSHHFLATIVSISIDYSNPTWDEIIEIRNLSKELLLNYWLNETVFSLNWWFLLITTIGFFVIWVIVLDKTRIIEIMVYGLLIGTLGFILDMIGISFVLWSYPDRLTPVMSSMMEIHKMHMPVFYMLIYQYFRTWGRFLVAITITAFVFAFVFEPITVWLGIYEIYNWNYAYSFPIYIAIGVFFKWLIMKLKKVERERSQPYS
ncbi:MAG: hypothetical protein LRY73_01065 [Bacillus sp. (in: Bacteria)]|nr:hypothetical protein [Bacillus sp. (in: firmicutes)]